jgi:hypothetical protein
VPGRNRSYQRHMPPTADGVPVDELPGKFLGGGPIRAGVSIRSGGELPARYRTAADRTPARKVVTGRLLGDPPPHRAGKAPDCEESLRKERSDEAYRLLGREPPDSEYGILDLETVRAQRDRLAPRRWRPPFKEAAE